jgi:UDP-N-acetylmuramoylalanine--D-glutamate ligase
MTYRGVLAEIKAAGKKVVVVGLGISGVECARFLATEGLSVVVVEKESEESFRTKSKFVSELSALNHAHVSVLFGIDGERIAPVLEGAGLVLLSPGVALESAVVGTIKRLGVPFVSELELGVQLHAGESVVVTGSNGKSTTASLIDYIFRRAGKRSYLCGNVGTPVISNEELLAEVGASASTLVVEASSYQLEACTVLKPAISVVLNVSENHLERHGSLERYAAAKARVLQLQGPEDLAILNADDSVVLGMRQRTRASIALFGEKTPTELSKLAKHWASISYATSRAGVITVSMNGELEEYATENAKLLGAHNRYDMAAAILAARCKGVPRNVIQASLETFLPLEHRLEIVWREGNKAVINDSKSTTVAASLAALATVTQQFPEDRIILMIGGLSKAGSWIPLLQNISKLGAQRVSVICFGKDGKLLASHCRSAGVSHIVVPKLLDATRDALSMIAGGGVALLSPGCASFDEFTDFEERGREFKRYLDDIRREELQGAA